MKPHKVFWLGLALILINICKVFAFKFDPLLLLMIESIYCFILLLYLASQPYKEQRKDNLFILGTSTIGLFVLLIIYLIDKIESNLTQFNKYIDRTWEHYSKKIQKGK